MKENLIQIKSYAFALEIVKAYKELTSDKKEYILSKQLLRSGTSIGANISEAVEGQSRKDFIAKLSISKKEAGETLFWINLLRDSDFLPSESAHQLSMNCREIQRILNAIISSTRKNGL